MVPGIVMTGPARTFLPRLGVVIIFPTDRSLDITCVAAWPQGGVLVSLRIPPTDRCLRANMRLIVTLITGGHRTRVAAVTLDNMADHVFAQREDLPYSTVLTIAFLGISDSIG